ncbi:hypothetical protein [uncultured Devosia sp.]|uniref:hypothetical protein n=1 Tax=uncultured Devosia sp. TaxID=211434 RepID=UPI0026215444|nr:hypothetical protein [uncultured Devosia sp.]
MLRFKEDDLGFPSSAYPFEDGWHGVFNPGRCHFGSSEHTSTQTQTNQPWAPQQPYLTSGFSAAGNLLNGNPPQQQNTVAPFNGAQSSALNGIIQTAANGSPIVDAANGFATNLENGGYFNSNPALSYFQSLAGTNLGLTSPGATLLQSLGGTNAGAGAPGSDILSNLAGSNVGASNPGTDILSNLAGTNFGTSGAGAGVLDTLAKSNPGVGGAGSSALNDYASGKYLNANGYGDDVAQNVMSQVVPQVSAVFNRGNAINNPSVARAAAEGVTSALAPIEYQNFQTQEGLQKDAASTLASNQIAGANSQGTFANLAQQLGLSGAELQGNLAQNIAGNTLSGAQLSGNAAQDLAGNYITGQGQQIGAAGDLTSGAISGANTQTTAAGGISQNFQDVLDNMLKGNALAPQNQALSYSDLQQLFNAGTAQQTQAQNEASAKDASYNFGQMSPYQQLQAYMQAVTGNYGGTQTTKTPYYTNDTANTLGTISSGASLIGSLAAFL